VSGGRPASLELPETIDNMSQTKSTLRNGAAGAGAGDAKWVRKGAEGGGDRVLQLSTDLAYLCFQRFLRGKDESDQDWVVVARVKTPGRDKHGDPEAYFAGLKRDGDVYARQYGDYIPLPCNQGAVPMMSLFQGFRNEEGQADLSTLPERNTVKQLQEMIDEKWEGVSVLCDRDCFFNGMLHVVVPYNVAAWRAYAAEQRGKKVRDMPSKSKSDKTATVTLADLLKKPARKQKVTGGNE